MDRDKRNSDAKDIVILNRGSYGKGVMIQVLDRDSSSVPVRIPLDKLRVFAQQVLEIDPLISEPTEPPVKPTVEPAVTRTKTDE